MDALLQKTVGWIHCRDAQPGVVKDRGMIGDGKKSLNSGSVLQRSNGRAATDETVDLETEDGKLEKFQRSRQMCTFRAAVH
ncbi:uncharacterized protein SPSK_08205 [Sporothrix schenckii 1099-18]|uniref:Uncharacterized protein n=1 Tax=Sporothrix schenckii 1099-18 TaxID=1397361 RepID=A0A0F2MI31_SPOSC|nr:uncharacterized protein SPSK_08205 [Sporothrix schenckii 1099-18]KJR87836.1 hypothetical protein SPSK_08205 [Sporothrix schenckii 1099-18]